MPGKSSKSRAELAVQNARLLEIFEAAGHEFIDPEIIQPADVFLERAGEDIRSRTYVFTDPEGKEFCLRPDLTVPTCRYHLQTAKSPQTQARYCYNGPAFRHHGIVTNTAREVDQLGLEWFGAADPEIAEAEIFNLTIAAMEKAGLKNYSVRIGDLGLFHALLDAMEMPSRWRRRLAHEFWRPRAFHTLLRHLTGQQPQPQNSVSALIGQLAQQSEQDVRSSVEKILDKNDWQMVPGRKLDEIVNRLAEKAADENAMPLDKQFAVLINTYLNVHGSIENTRKGLRSIAKNQSASFSKAVDALARRTDLFDLKSMQNGEISFAAEFGRSLEYYTGFVFQIEVTDKAGGPVVIAGGGRYDDLISDIGKCQRVPAVGCAIYTQRLLAAIKGQNQ